MFGGTRKVFDFGFFFGLFHCFCLLRLMVTFLRSVLVLVLELVLILKGGHQSEMMVGVER